MKRKNKLLSAICGGFTAFMFFLPVRFWLGDNASLVIAQSRDVVGLDYALVSQTETQNISNNIFDALVRLNSKGEYAPWLAKSWDNPDDKTWVFHLEKGVKFTNGEPLDAAAVKYSLERVMDPKLNPPRPGGCLSSNQLRLPILRLS